MSLNSLFKHRLSQVVREAVSRGVEGRMARTIFPMAAVSFSKSDRFMVAIPLWAGRRRTPSGGFRNDRQQQMESARGVFPPVDFVGDGSCCLPNVRTECYQWSWLPTGRDIQDADVRQSGDLP